MHTDMTLESAKLMMHRPVFGDETCIYARRLLELGLEVQAARQAAKAAGATCGWASTLHMNHAELTQELGKAQAIRAGLERKA
jgi:hypothetical protein